MKHTRSMVRMALLLLATLVLMLSMAASVGANPDPGSVIDFEQGLKAGDFVSSVSSGSGISGDAVSGSISVWGANSTYPGQNAAMIFDATCGDGPASQCSGDDPDLFQPEQGNVLIVSEDLDQSDPDDKIGGTLAFDFSAWGSGTAKVESIVVLDTEEAGTIELFSGGVTGNLLSTVTMPILPNGGITTTLVGVSGVDFMRVRFYGSGATDDIRIVAEIASLGDYVWEDVNANGIQEIDEPGINGVTVNLLDCEGNPVLDGSANPITVMTHNDPSDNPGYYLFDNLVPGCYIVEFVAPPGFVFSPQDQGVDDTLDSDADTTTGKTGPIDLESGETDLTWDAGLIGPVCDLVVIKSCLVAPPPVDVECSDKIVATTLRYIGPTVLGATVEVDPDKGPTVVYENVDLISGDTILTSPAESGFTIDGRPEENELGAKTKIRINGAEEVIHTSCSTPYVAGQPAPLDKPKGDPSPNWFVEKFVDKDSDEIVTVPPDPVPAEECVVTLGPAPSCETEGKPSNLTFRYTGESCAASENDQGDKFKCTDIDGLDPEQPVQVVYTGKDPAKFTVTPASVELGEPVAIEATGRSEFHADTKLEIRQGGALIQSLTIHTSCSKPLAVGDVFGSLELVKFNSKSAGVEVTYTYTITNNGDPLTGVTLFDIPLGHIAGLFDLAAGETRTFEMVTEIFETTENTAVVSGLLANGEPCETKDGVTVAVEEPPPGPQVCTSRVQAMLLRYTGPDIAGPTRVAFDPDKGATVTYDLAGGLASGTVLSMPAQNDWTIDATVSGENELGAKTKIRINGVEEVIHTSCSTPFVVGAPAPLDKPKGDPSPNWFVESFRQK